jgi:TonB-linked SusC/RagA family outer membrane protein
MKKKQLLVASILLAMRLTFVQIVLTVVFTSSIYANNVEAQSVLDSPITLTINNSPVFKVIQDIEKQTNTQFSYSANAIRGQRIISFSVVNKKLSDLFREVFAPMNIGYLIVNDKVVLYPIHQVDNLKGQNVLLVVNEPVNKIISGKITSMSGEPLSGVSVQLKGTNIGTTSDAEGKFTLNVPENGVLRFTSVGYEIMEVVINGRSTINATLKEQNSELNQVVVVGYGTQKKKDLTGTVASIEGKDLQVAPTPDVFNNLAGKLPGVIVTQSTGQPGYDEPVFSIRGKSTFGDNSALVLVDGIERPFTGDPNDIENVSILKDAASAAVYGARGANGVVLITTKRGKTGKAQVSYSGSVGIQQATVRPEMMNSYQYAKYFNEARLGSGDVPYYTDAEVEKFRLGNDPAYPNTNWLNVAVKKSAPIQQNNVTFQGGTDKVDYIVSYGNLNQQGLYDPSYFKRNNLRTTINFKITDNLSVMVNVAGSFKNSSQSASDASAWAVLLNSNPGVLPYVPDAVEKGGLRDNGTGITPIGLFYRSGYDKRYTTLLQNTAEVNYKLPWVKGLSAKGRFAYDKSLYHSKQFTTPYTFYSYDRANNIYDTRRSLPSSNLSESRGENTQSTLQLSLNYDQQFGRHNFAGLLLYEQSEGLFSDISAYREGYISSAIDQIYAGGAINKANGGSASENARQGYVGRVNYSFADRYLFQANFRYDGSYNFAPGKRWGFFPAVSAGWRVSEEPFMKGVSFLSNMKLRASYGQFGNDRISPYQYLAGYTYGAGYVLGSTYHPGITNAGEPNPNVTWETATNTDIGLDLGFFTGKLEAELTYFSKRTKDILLKRNASVPLTTGAALPDENIGIVDNRGIELLLRHTKRGAGLNYSVEGMVTYARNNVVFMDEPIGVTDRIRRTGHPFDQFYGLVALGLFQNQKEIDDWADQDGQKNASLKPGDIKYQDIDNNGKIDGFDVKQIGKSPTPELVYGLNLSASYKGVGVSANFQGATGFNRDLHLTPFQLDANALAVSGNAWRPDNPNAAYPRLSNTEPPNQSRVSSFWLVDNTYLRLRNVQVFYQLSNSLVHRIGLKGIRIFVSGNNVLTFSKRKWVDPELNPVGNFDRLSYPHLKSYNVGINVNF